MLPCAASNLTPTAKPALSRNMPLNEAVVTQLIIPDKLTTLLIRLLCEILAICQFVRQRTAWTFGLFVLPF